MTLRQSRLLLEAIGRDDARRLHDAAVAARMAGVDSKTWKKFSAEVLSHGD